MSGENRRSLKKIQTVYEKKCRTVSDINRLLPALKDYSEGCGHITELGVREVTSTWAFLAAGPDRLVCYDIIYHPNIEEAKQAASEAGIDFEFRKADVLDSAIEETDLLFCDTFHHYYQLLSELRLHSGRVGKYIIMHDTTTYGRKNEVLAEDCVETFRKMGKDMTGYETQEKSGLMRAIRDFLRENRHWKKEKRIFKNNGLTVLSRSRNIPRCR